jgi:hypothetical protein
MNRPHPELLETLWTSGAISKMGIPEAPECMVPRLARAGERVDEPESLFLTP